MIESATVAVPEAGLSWSSSFRALAALFVLALRQQVHGWRLVVLGLLFLLPGVLAVLVYLTRPWRPRHDACRGSRIQVHFHPGSACPGPAGRAALCGRHHPRRGRRTDADLRAPASAAASGNLRPQAAGRAGDHVAA